MNIYTLNYRIRSIDVDQNRRLRTSVLFSMLQEAAIAHTEALGMGREKTLDKGLLWIVTHQRAEIQRMPEYDEDIVLRSWPGDNMHLLFPRYYSLETSSGEPLLKASALWSLMDKKSRSVVFPENYGIVIDGVRTGDEIALPSSVRSLPCADSRTLAVPYSFVDLNGHMNNTRYFDIAEDLVYGELCLLQHSGEDAPHSGGKAGPSLPDAEPGPNTGKTFAHGQSTDNAASMPRLRAINTEFALEIKLGETFTISWGSKDGRYFFTGAKGIPAVNSTAEDPQDAACGAEPEKQPKAASDKHQNSKQKTCFKLSLEYEES